MIYKDNNIFVPGNSDAGHNISNQCVRFFHSGREIVGQYNNGRMVYAMSEVENKEPHPSEYNPPKNQIWAVSLDGDFVIPDGYASYFNGETKFQLKSIKKVDGIVQITLSGEVNKIGSVFRKLSNVKAVYLPESVTNCFDHCFYQSSIEHIVAYPFNAFDSDVFSGSDIKRILFRQRSNDPGSYQLYFKPDSTSIIEFEPGFKRINFNSLYNTDSLEIILPDSIETLEGFNITSNYKPKLLYRGSKEQLDEVIGFDATMFSSIIYNYSEQYNYYQ